jgi:hypothetical protein
MESLLAILKLKRKLLMRLLWLLTERLEASTKTTLTTRQRLALEHKQPKTHLKAPFLSRIHRLILKASFAIFG